MSEEQMHEIEEESEGTLRMVAGCALVSVIGIIGSVIYWIIS